MKDANYSGPTLPQPHAASAGPAVLALTILWHPEPERIGAQYLHANASREIELSRLMPMFGHPGQEGVPLGYSGVSRLPLKIVQNGGRVHVFLPQSTMMVELNGSAVAHPVSLEQKQIAAGVTLGLGKSILLCIHWMNCQPRSQNVPGFPGVGSAALRTRELIRGAAALPVPVLLLGESGSGQEIAAQAIHTLRHRNRLALVGGNLAALDQSRAAVELFGAAKGADAGAHVARSGLLEQANGGTLFLDDIGNTPAAVQAMLLRFLENGVYRPVGATHDCHSSAALITATDQELYATSFNQALLRRLEARVIALPPLRERREDIGILMRHFHALDEIANGPAPALNFAMVSAFATYDWPGNVRQLGQVLSLVLQQMRRGLVPSLADLVFDSTPAGVDAASPAAQRRLPSANDILSALDSNDWLIQGAVRALGVSRPTMNKLISLHPQIRSAESIGRAELGAAWSAAQDDLKRCAAILKTPAEPLRRHLRSLGMTD